LSEKFQLTPTQLKWPNHKSPVNSEFDDIYFDIENGLAESNYVFLDGNCLAQRFSDCCSRFTIAETGFGTGLNFLLSCQLWQEKAPDQAELWYFSFERFPISGEDLCRAHRHWPELEPLSNQLLDRYPPLIKGWHILQFHGLNVNLVLILDDISELSQLSIRVDAWFLDGFDPKKNPEMWSDQVFSNMARLSSEGASYSTFTVAGAVKRGLQKNGFSIEKRKGFGRKREMLTGRLLELKSGFQSKTPWYYRSHSKPTSKKEVSIVGAGIAGLSCAVRFASAGWAVTLYDSREMAMTAASGNLSAVLMPKLPTDLAIEGQFYQYAFLYAVSYLDHLQARFPELAWNKSGVLQRLTQEQYIAISDLRMPEDYARLVHTRSSADDFHVEFSRAGWLEPHSLRGVLSQLGIRFVGSCHIEKVVSVEGSHGLYDGSGNLVNEVETLILANAMAITKDERFGDLELHAVRGQVTHLEGGDLSSQVRQAVFEDKYIVPTRNGGAVIGATFDWKNIDEQLRSEDHKKNLLGLSGEFIRADIDMESLQGKAGIRAMTRDHLPVVGLAYDAPFYKTRYADIAYGKRPREYPLAKSLDGLYLSVGHGARGFTSAFLAAEFLFNEIAHGQSILPERLRTAIHPARFLIRKLKRVRNV